MFEEQDVLSKLTVTVENLKEAAVTLNSTIESLVELVEKCQTLNTR